MSSNPYLQFSTPQAPRKTRIDNEKSIKVGKQVPFPYGNYHNYYSNRTLGFRTDPRLKVFKREWFNGKAVLDIGCNAGHVSLAVFKLFNPKSIEGVDVDPVLISKCRHNLLMTKSSAFETNQGIIWDYFPVSAPLQLGYRQSNTANITFRCSDWVHEPIDTTFDTILALSITKWIQLNHGDGAIRHFFQKCFDCLNPLGILILEPQPIQGYKKHCTASERMLNNYKEIEFFPTKFADYLVKKLGFQLLLEHEFENDSKGFKRPLLVLQKPECRR